MHRSLAMGGALRRASCALARPTACSMPAAAAQLPQRSFHASPSLAHNRPHWPQHSAHHFRDKAESDRQALLAQVEAAWRAPLPEPYRSEHPHPAPLPASVFEGENPPPAHFAVMRYRNEQYKVVQGDLVMVNRVPLPVGSRLLLPDVLLLGGRDRTLIGRPRVAGALVEAVVEEHTQTEKVIVFHKKRRKHSKKKQGHRDHVSTLRIERVLLPPGSEALTVGAQAECATEEQIRLAAEEEMRRQLRGHAEALKEPLGLDEAVDADSQSIQSPTSSSSSSPSSAPLGARAYSTFARPRASFPSTLSSRSFSTAAASGAATPASTEESVRALLQEKLSPEFLHVEDVSGGCGAFFRLVVVSAQFRGLGTLQQQRLVNAALKEHIANLHGMQISTNTPEEWEEKTKGKQ